jgi:hypothetical protein
VSLCSGEKKRFANIIGVVTECLCCSLPIDSRLVDMTNYLVHKTYTPSDALSPAHQTSVYIFLFEEDKQTNFIFPAARKVEIKNRAHKLLDRSEINTAVFFSVRACICIEGKYISWLGKLKSAERRLKFTFDFPGSE